MGTTGDNASDETLGIRGIFHRPQGKKQRALEMWDFITITRMRRKERVAVVGKATVLPKGD